MPRECAGLREGHAAGLAPKRSLSRVYTNVRSKAAQALKRLAARRALVYAWLRLLLALRDVGPLARPIGPSVGASARVCVVGPLAGGAGACVRHHAVPVTNREGKGQS